MTFKEFKKRFWELQKERLLRLKIDLKGNEVFLGDDIFEIYKRKGKVSKQSIKKYFISLAEEIVNKLKTETYKNYHDYTQHFAVELMNIAELLYHYKENEDKKEEDKMELKEWVENVREKKNKLEKEIYEMIKDFEKDTGIEVSYLKLTTTIPPTPEHEGREVVVGVDVRI